MVLSPSSQAQASSGAARLPVTVVTGFLGAGKTTLLRHLLLHGGQRLAVLVNEFGEVGIDGDLIASCGFCPDEELEGRVVELANGCLCCTVQEEFLPTMNLLLERAASLDGIVVETSGLALPAPLLAAFGWPEIRTRTRVNAVVTVVDGEALAAGHVVGDAEAVEAQRRADPSLDHLGAIEELFADQLEAADLVLVSRADRVDAEALGQVMEDLRRRLRPGISVLPMARGGIDPALVLGSLGEPGQGQRGAAQGDPREDPRRHHGVQGHNGSHTHHGGPHDHHEEHDDHHEHHDHTHVALEAVVVRRSGAIERSSLEAALRQLLERHPVLRLKGRLHQCGKRLPLQIQAVGRRLDCWYEGPADPQVTEGELELVALVAARDAAPIRAALENL